MPGCLKIWDSKVKFKGVVLLRTQEKIQGDRFIQIFIDFLVGHLVNQKIDLGKIFYLGIYRPCFALRHI